MERFIEFRAIGSEPDCDLTVEADGVAGKHARLALRSDGSLVLMDNSRAELWLSRGGSWVRARRVRLCAGDRVRLGVHEIPLVKLAGLFMAEMPELASGTQWPVPLNVASSTRPDARRNPGTGQVEASNKEYQDS